MTLIKKQQNPNPHSSTTCTSPSAFASATLITLASGHTTPISTLRRGHLVLTPLGPRRVAALLITRVTAHPIARLRTVLVTPDHPVSPDGHHWYLSRAVAGGSGRYTGRLCSVILEEDRDERAHAVWVGGRVGGFWGVTMGHGVCQKGREDVRGHEFWGGYAEVVRELRGLGVSGDGVVWCGGVVRDRRGMVRGLALDRRRVVQIVRAELERLRRMK